MDTIPSELYSLFMSVGTAPALLLVSREFSRQTTAWIAGEMHDACISHMESLVEVCIYDHSREVLCAWMRAHCAEVVLMIHTTTDPWYMKACTDLMWLCFVRSAGQCCGREIDRINQARIARYGKK